MEHGHPVKEGLGMSNLAKEGKSFDFANFYEKRT
jgi:hypothetical protein